MSDGPARPSLALDSRYAETSGRVPKVLSVRRGQNAGRLLAYSAFVVATAVGLALAGASFKGILVFLLILGGIGLILAGQSSALVGSLAIVASFAVGYRTIEVTRVLRIHPTEVLIWIGAAIVVVTGKRTKLPHRLVRLPRWILASIPFWALAWVVGAARGLPWDAMTAEMKDFLLLLPLFLVLRRALLDARSWRLFRDAFVSAGSFVAVLGLIEYVLPGFVAHFSGFMANSAPMVTGGGFARARFSFWGSPGASFMCYLAFPFALGAWMSPPKSIADWGRRVAAIILGSGIFIGGYRSLWLATVFVLVLSLVVHARRTLALVLLLAGTVSLVAVPRVTETRFESALQAVSFRAEDSSARKRYSRLDKAIEQVASDPFGGGWSSAGWVHSDFAQIAANQGVLAAVIFIGGFFSTLFGLWRAARRFPIFSEGHELSLELFLAILMSGVLLAVQGVEVLPQYCVPVWFIWLWSGIWLQMLGRRRCLA